MLTDIRHRSPGHELAESSVLDPGQRHHLGDEEVQESVSIGGGGLAFERVLDPLDLGLGLIGQHAVGLALPRLLLELQGGRVVRRPASAGLEEG